MNGTTIEDGTILDSNDTIALDDCPPHTPKFVYVFTFWVEGIIQAIVCILGICGNIVAGFILSRREMRNAFNLLLVTLACFDSTYLFGSILESFRKHFHLATDVHIILFPYVLYPFTQIAITGSIFMTIAIALERFIAVHYPLDYSQAMHEANALTKRIFKYVSVVSFLSLAFTITRFFEAKIHYYPMYKDDNGVRKIVDNDTELTNITSLHDIYEGPFIEPTDMRTSSIYITYHNWSKLIVMGLIPYMALIILNYKIFQDIKARRNRRMATRNIKPATQTNAPKLTTTTNGNKLGEQTSKLLQIETNGEAKEQEVAETEVIELKSTRSSPPMPPKEQKPIQPPPPSIAVNESRRKKEDNMAVIFMGFILVTLICNFPRLVMNIHELWTIRHAMKCQEAGKNGFPLWTEIAISISHLLLVVNSSTNIFIYCFLSSAFRAECAKLYQSVCRKLWPA